MSILAPQRLREIPLFAELSSPALESLAEIAIEVDVPAGQVLTRPDDSGMGMFVIEQGTVTVELKERVIELGPGEFFGELALLIPEGVRVARVRAETDVRMLALARDDFARLLEQEPSIAVAMLPVLARRLSNEIRAH
ncbi:MAG TPA: cyclic nucleotide-binding domain-containing protein [Gaiellaceae bacterium]|nr:cyclic nucleotide-binding domain-containing protein [Gaiellaceae bacterium]